MFIGDCQGVKRNGSEPSGELSFDVLFLGFRNKSLDVFARGYIERLVSDVLRPIHFKSWPSVYHLFNRVVSDERLGPRSKKAECVPRLDAMICFVISAQIVPPWVR